MAWSIRTDKIKRIHSFAEAEKFWKETPVWKGQDESWRPLDSRRMPHKRLVKRDDGGYACVLYGTAIVIYYPDRIELNTYDSVSTTAFAWCVAPHGCRITSANASLYWRVKTAEGDYYYRHKNGIKLKSVGDDTWELDGPVDTAYEWSYDPKLGAAARKLIKPYKTWFELSTRLGLKLPTYLYTKNYHERAIEKLLAAPEDVQLIAEMAQVIGLPQNALNSAYIHLGARYKTPVPHDRLPRRSAI